MVAWGKAGLRYPDLETQLMQITQSIKWLDAVQSGMRGAFFSV
jgi:hypothetical protein